MATTMPTEGDNQDNYELELNRVREKVKTIFAELADCLKARENQLLIELDNILASYISFQTELEEVNEEKRNLETTKTRLQIQLESPTNISIHENLILQVNTELKSIETPTEPKMFTFVCDSNKILAEVNKLGKFVEKVRSGIDYKSKEVSVCLRECGNQQLTWPRGVTVDERTANIYVADQVNNCVKEFDSTGKYLSQFGEKKGEGMMDYPRGVVICGDGILITQRSNCILYYQLNGMFLFGIGRKGRGELEFDYPYSLTVGESNGCIYICERNNNRVQILNKDFSFKAQFGVWFVRTI